jgi:hypothetical protein
MYYMSGDGIQGDCSQLLLLLLLLLQVHHSTAGIQPVLPASPGPAGQLILQPQVGVGTVGRQNTACVDCFQ